MASKIGDLYWQVDADTSKFDKGLKSTDKSAKGMGKTFSTLAKGIVAGLGVAAVAGVAKLSKELISAASEAEETRNKFDVVYRDISVAAEAAAQNLADNFGLSGTAARSLLADTGDLLTGFGFTQESALDLSDQVNQLAVDLASFTNFSGGAKGASEALTKALLGERESVKALGISILDADVKAKVLENTQAGLTFETERQAKAYATLQIAQAQSQNAIGDFERSIDSYANQVRIAEANTEDLKVALGENLLPIATKSVGIFNNLTASITKSVSEMNKLRSILADLEDGTQDEARSLEELQAALALLEEKAKAGSSARVRYNDEINTLKTLIDTYGIEDTFLAKREGRIASEEANAKAIAESEAAERERLDALRGSTEALDRLEELRRDSMTADEQKLADLQTEINYWNTLRGLAPGAEEVFIQLATQRNALQESINKGLQEEQEIVFGLYQTRTEQDKIFRDAVADAEARQAEAQAEKNAELEREAQLVQDLADRYESMGQIGLSVIGDVGYALASGEDAWKAFAKSGINAVAGIIDSLAQQMLAQAASLVAAAFFSGGTSLAGVGPALAGAAAASLAAGALRGYAGTFEQGGIVPQPPGVPATGDNVMIRANPGERIVPRDEATGLTQFTFMLDGDIISDKVVKNINRGRYLIDLSTGAY
jgi:hypothetical protein